MPVEPVGPYAHGPWNDGRVAAHALALKLFSQVAVETPMVKAPAYS